MIQLLTHTTTTLHTAQLRDKPPSSSGVIDLMREQTSIQILMTSYLLMSQFVLYICVVFCFVNKHIQPFSFIITSRYLKIEKDLTLLLHTSLNHNIPCCAKYYISPTLKPPSPSAVIDLATEPTSRQPWWRHCCWKHNLFLVLYLLKLGVNFSILFFIFVNILNIFD